MFGVYTFSTIPKTVHPGSRLVVVYSVYAGVENYVLSSVKWPDDDDDDDELVYPRHRAIS